MSKERLTRFVTQVGKCMTTLNSLKHYMPCVTCRNNAKIKTDTNGEQYTEKFNFCDTCEVKMLFNRLKEYEDAEEQGLLLRLPCKVGDTVYYPEKDYDFVYPIRISQIIVSDLGEGKQCRQYNGCFFDCNGDAEMEFEFDSEDFGKTIFFTQSEAEEKLRELEEK